MKLRWPFLPVHLAFVFLFAYLSDDARHCDNVPLNVCGWIVLAVALVAFVRIEVDFELANEALAARRVVRSVRAVPTRHVADVVDAELVDADLVDDHRRN